MSARIHFLIPSRLFQPSHFYSATFPIRSSLIRSLLIRSFLIRLFFGCHNRVLPIGLKFLEAMGGTVSQIWDGITEQYKQAGSCGDQSRMNLMSTPARDDGQSQGTTPMYLPAEDPRSPPAPEASFDRTPVQLKVPKNIKDDGELRRKLFIQNVERNQS